MSRIPGVVLSGFFVLCFASFSHAQPFPAAGQDNISTSGFFKFELLGGTSFNFTLGPNATVIGRSGPHAETSAADSAAIIDNATFTMPGSGIAADAPLLPADWPESDAARREVHTEILDMALTDGSVTLRVGQSFWNSVNATQAFLYGNSFGEVASNNAAGTVANDFPAQGVFNICAEFDHPVQGKLYNRSPMLIRKTQLLGFPPNISNSATQYMHDPSFMGATFFTSTGIPVGKLLSAGHGATTAPNGTPDMLPPLRCPVSFTVDILSVGLANGLPNQVNLDATGADPRLDVTVYVSRSGGGPGGARPGLPDGSNALSGSFTGAVVAPFPDFVAADAITSFSYGQDGTIPLVVVFGKRRGNIYFSLDRASPPAAAVCFGAASVGANVYASVTPPFGSYVDVLQAPALPGKYVLVVDSNELGLAPAFGGAVDDEVTGLELKDEIQLNPASLFWFGTLAGPANPLIAGVGDTATIYVYDPVPLPGGGFEPGNFGIYATPVTMGLVAADMIDALVLSDTEASHTLFAVATPDGILQPNAWDEALFSLSRTSPTLLGIDGAPGLIGVDDDGLNGIDDAGEVGLGDDFSPADIFYTDFDGTFVVFIPAAAMGLSANLDNIDAADVKPTEVPKKCGNDDRETDEECDGTDDAACPGECQVDCTCPLVAVCGNNIKEGSEECDGQDDAACPGDCQADCTCAPVCGNNVKEGLEECDGTDNDLCLGDCQPDCTCAPGEKIPTASEWGLMTMALLLLVAGTVAVGWARRRTAPA